MPGCNKMKQTHCCVCEPPLPLDDPAVGKSLQSEDGVSLSE